MSSTERGTGPDSSQVGSTQVLLTDLFRRESGRLIAVLTARTGPQHLDRVQDAVQDAMVAALRTWPWRGVPANPSGWLYIAARNALFDRLRRARCEAPDELLQAAAAPGTGGDAELEDDLLRLIVYCCHPLLSQNAQLALTLRLACGLSVEEIGGALLTAPAAIAQRIARAKRELREQRVALALPDATELAETRLPSVLQALYLLFNAGSAVCALSQRHRHPESHHRAALRARTARSARCVHGSGRAALAAGLAPLSRDLGGPASGAG